MKLLLSILSSASLYFLLITGSAHLAGCEKATVHDTTINTIHDTTIKTVRDTLTLRDTLYELQDGLVAYYNFDGGNLNDSSGNNNNIVFNNAVPAADRFGNSGNAFSFDGNNSYMQVLNSPSLNPSAITLFAIVKVNGFYSGECHGNRILCKGAPDDVVGHYLLGFNDPTQLDAAGCSTNPDITKEFFSGGYGDDNPVGSAAIAGNDSFPFIHPGEWATAIFTCDGKVSKMYVNGALLSTVAKSVPFTPDDQDLYIGKMNSPAFPYYFTGIIDEIRIYNKVIPDERIHILSSLKARYLTASAQ